MARCVPTGPRSEHYRIMPRHLRDVANRDLGIKLFGQRLPAPIILAPIGVQSMLHADAELAVARAARSLGMPLVLSSVSSTPLEAVAEALGDSLRWFQLYWSKNPDLTASLVCRAERAGYSDWWLLSTPVCWAGDSTICNWPGCRSPTLKGLPTISATPCSVPPCRCPRNRTDRGGPLFPAGGRQPSPHLERPGPPPQAHTYAHSAQGHPSPRRCPSSRGLGSQTVLSFPTMEAAGGGSGRTGLFARGG